MMSNEYKSKRAEFLQPVCFYLKCGFWYCFILLQDAATKSNNLI